MKYLFSMLALLLTLTSIQCILNNNDSYTEVYNLDFKLKDGKISWLSDRGNYCEIKIDSTEVIDGKNPILFSQWKFFGKPAKLSGSIFQTILLPEGKADSLLIKINCKSENLKKAQLIISSFDQQELLLRQDTLSMLGLDGWRTYKIMLPGRNVRVLNLAITVKGMDSFISQRLWLDKITIDIDKKDINTFKIAKLVSNPIIDKKYVTPLSFLNDTSYNSVKELKTKKIVAIGETVHGTETMVAVGAQLIKHQVTYNKSKLVLFEIPMEHTFMMNRFIQGDKTIKIEELFKNYHLSLFSPHVLKDLLIWLKEYNTTAEEKVCFLGIDQSFDKGFSLFILSDYLRTINRQTNAPVVNTLISMLSDEKKTPQIQELLENSKELKSILGSRESELLKHYLNNMEKLPKGYMVAPAYLRDRYMFKNIEFLLNLVAPVSKKAIIYAHFGHTNPKSNLAFNPASLSFGSYIKQKYKEDYYSIAILTANGKFRTTDKDSLLVKRSLELPVDNSLEKSLSSLGEDYCFMPVKVLTPEILRIRDVGNSYIKKQFDMIAPASRMDGLIYIQNSKEFDVLKDSPVLGKDVNRYYMDHILRTMKSR